MDEDRYMPLGFAFQMATNENAMINLAKLTEEEKKDVIDKAKQVKSKDEMKSIVEDLGNRE